MNLFKRSSTWWGILAVLGVGAVIAYRTFEAEAPPELRYDVAKTDRGNVVAKVTATGTLSALVTVQVGSQVSGRLKQIFVDYNSPVTKGQVLAKIDPQLFEAALEQARANFIAAQANETKARVQAEEAERQLIRSQSLAEQKLVAEADRDTARSTRDAAKAAVAAAAAEVAQMKAALHQAEINLAYTTISSPINGVVITRSVDVGQTVAASLQAPTLFILAEDLRKMQVDTSVSEADIGKLEPGMPATFLVDAFPGKEFSGTVRQIRNSPQTLQNVVTYDAVIDVDNPELELRPGMTANVTFVYAHANDVVRVPNAALRFRPSPEVLADMEGRPREGRGRMSDAMADRPPEAAADVKRPESKDPSQKIVWVLGDDGKAKRVSIRTGVSDGSMSELLSGDLQPGTSLVIGVKGPPRGGPPMRMF